MEISTIFYLNDDATGLARAMRATLATLGHYAVAEAETIDEALSLLRRELPGLIMIDLRGPDAALAACREIREYVGFARPIIVLSESNTERDRIAALDAGADDFIARPIGVEELLARIRAAVRRAPPAQPEEEIFIDGDLKIDFERRCAIRAGKRFHLTPKEHDVLQFLLRNPGRPVTHRKLLQAVWGPEYGDECEYLRTIMRQLRMKIEPEPSKPKYLLTERSLGYLFAVN
jgi:two-component system KDP operon response regulator KdpE